MRKYIAYIIGLTILSIGIALILQANVGLGAWDIYFLNIVEATNTNFTIIQSINSLILVTASYIILKQFPDKQVLLIILNATYIGFVLDKALLFVQVPDNMILGYIQLFSAIALIAVGANIARVTKIILPAMDFFNQTIHIKTELSFGRVKQIIEFTVMIIGVAIGFIFDLPFRLGVGTIIILFFGGYFVNLFYEPIRKILGKVNIN